MQLRNLGKSGLRVSEICLGSITFGGQTSAWDARQIMDEFVHNGGNFIDTANSYNDGAAEETIGQWMLDGGHRPHTIIGTKTHYPEHGQPHRLSRSALISAVDASLRRLKTDYIDVYYLHYWDTVTPLEETLYTIENLVQAGKIRYVAASNLQAWQVMKIVSMQRQQAWSPLIAVQAAYSLLDRRIEHELVGMLQSEGLGLLAWGVLGGGFLTGKYHPNKPPNTKVRWGRTDMGADYYRLFARWEILEALTEIAGRHSVDTTDIALAWVLGQTPISAALLGVSQIAHIDSNMGNYGVQLSQAEYDTLAAVSSTLEAPRIADFFDAF